MPLQKSEAVILRSINQGETSKILTLYTRTFGKISVMAKGARNIKSRFGGALEPLNHVSVVYFEKENRELQILSQADILDAFSAIKKDLKKISLASAVCELLNQLETTHDANPHLFHLLLKTLKTLNREGLTQPVNVLLAFSIKLLGAHGIQPDFLHCVQCGQKFAATASVDATRGGFLCSTCRKPEPTELTLSGESLQSGRALEQLPVERADTVTLSYETERQLRRFIHAYLTYHIEGFRELRAMHFYRDLERRSF